MSDAPDQLELVQRLDAALAEYQRQFGRERTIAKLEHMIAARREAQRVATDAQRADELVPRAAE